MKSKKDLREVILKRRDELSSYKRENYNTEIFHNIINTKEYKSCKCIFIFVSYKNEVDTHRIITKALEDNKVVCVPKIISKKEGMKSIAIRGFDDLEEGKFGILEPKTIDNEVCPKEIDLVIVPGLAFDKSGGRLGYGAGFYDRFMKKLKAEACKIGIGYDFQIIEEVPMEEHDLPIDKVITN